MPIIYYTGFTAFVLCYIVLPSVISFALEKELYTHVRTHNSDIRSTPALGGVGIFIGFFLAIFFWLPFTSLEGIRYVLLAILVAFLIGLRDDLRPLSAKKKLIAQLIAAILIVYFADIRLKSLYGIFSWEGGISYELSVLLSTFTVLVIINAFNLIDGINGLAASLAIIATAFIGSWFAAIGEVAPAVLAFSCMGSLLAFLRFNLLPSAKVFMGDTGSLVIGTIISTLCLEFIEANAMLHTAHPYRFEAIAVVAMGVISIPLFDTLRVFVARLIAGQAPFQPDRRHIHHLLIDAGYSHLRSTGVLTLFQLGLIGFVYALQAQVEQHILLVFLLSIILLVTYFLYRMAEQKKEEQLYVSSQKESNKLMQKVPTKQ